MGAPKCKLPSKPISWVELRALLIIVWRQGIKRSTRWKFWHHLFSMMKRNPAVWKHYLSTCAHEEHFLEYRQIVRDQIEAQVQDYLTEAERLKGQDVAIAPSSLMSR